VSIVGNGELKKIDKKFLPDDIGGMPEGGAPFQQLVTDGEGNTVWADRLAYEDPNAVTVILPETELEAMGEDGAFAYTQLLGITPAVGETYAVTYNGATYDCTAVDAATLSSELAGSMILGNVGVITGSGDTGEPFYCFVLSDALASQSGGSVQLMPFDGATSVTLAITKKGNIQRIPLKFLPKEMYGVEITKEGTLLDMRFFTEATSMIMVVEPTIPIGIVPGETYTVRWNGTDYPCIAEKRLVSTTPDVWAIYVEKPDVFQLSFFADGVPELGFVQSFDGTSKTQITISGKAGKIRKVPEQYLPDVVLTSPNGTKYKLSVDNQGNLSADALS
jgi:hypothetical protein